MKVFFSLFDLCFCLYLPSCLKVPISSDFTGVIKNFWLSYYYRVTGSTDGEHLCLHVEVSCRLDFGVPSLNFGGSGSSLRSHSRRALLCAWIVLFVKKDFLIFQPEIFSFLQLHPVVFLFCGVSCCIHAS